MADEIPRTHSGCRCFFLRRPVSRNDRPIREQVRVIGGDDVVWCVQSTLLASDGR